MSERKLLLEVKNLVTEFHTEEGIVRAINDISFDIYRGETVGIVGESGSGKSVTSLSIMQLIPIPPGKIAGGEILYQRYLNDNNRLEFDLGFRNSNNVDAFKLVGLYQWVNPLGDNFNWFVGVGAGVGSFDSPGTNGSFFLAAADLGIEYNFDIPLIMSLDIRPELGFNDEFSDDLDFDIALGIRYQF